MGHKKFLQRALALLIGCSMSLPLFSCNEPDSPFVHDSKYMTVTKFDEPVSLVDYRVTEYLSADPSVMVTSFLIEALLGLSKENLIRDYELSAFYYNYAHVNRNLQNGGNILKLLAGLEKYEGETLKDKCATFLLSVGVTQEEIDSIRSIFLG